MPKETRPVPPPKPAPQVAIIEPDTTAPPTGVEVTTALSAHTPIPLSSGVEVINIDEDESAHRPSAYPPYVPISNPYELVRERFLNNLRNPNEMIINHVIDTAALLLEHYGTNAFQTNPTPNAPQRVHVNAVLSFPLTTRECLLNPVGSTRYQPFPARHQIQAAILPLFLPAHFVTAL